ncbi:MAG: hypothetical protein JWP94_392 [Mucilaginibacter sp.]|nr:hypothetical protein [Mucilaginibacter sp.]
MNVLKKTCLILALIYSVSIARAQQSASTNAINKITNAYLAIKNSLVADDGTAAAHNAKELFNILSSDPGKTLKPDQQKLLNGYLEKLKFDSRHISEVTALDHQREHFATLSKNLYEVLKGLKMNTATIYEQYCPMKKTYWLSETEAVKNPYYGKKMPECGRVAATLTPATK